MNFNTNAETNAEHTNNKDYSHKRNERAFIHTHTHTLTHTHTFLMITTDKFTFVQHGCKAVIVNRPFALHWWWRFLMD